MKNKRGSAEHRSIGLFSPRGKKGLEMSIGLIVTLIISILIFSMSIYYLFKWFGSAEELKAEIDRQTENQITAALKTGNQLVAVPITLQEIKRGSAATFGVGIRFIGPETDKDFSMATSFSGAYTPDGRPICARNEACADEIDQKWLGNFAVTPTFNLKKNGQQIVPQLVKAETTLAGRQTPVGDYTFNICVYDNPLRSDGGLYAPCVQGQDLGAYYTNRMYQATVRIT